ncbi:hypothetical protein MKW92_053038, partial [Papaver armeniacum]
MDREWEIKHTRNKDLFFSQEKQESLCVMLRKLKPKREVTATKQITIASCHECVFYVG